MAVVIDLESPHTDERTGMCPQQVDESQRLNFISGGARVELDNSGSLFELVATLGVESVKQISDQ